MAAFLMPTAIVPSSERQTHVAESGCRNEWSASGGGTFQNQSRAGRDRRKEMADALVRRD
jgi:hypothetical protein